MPGREWLYELAENLQRIARKKVAGLAYSDEALLDRLARACASEARHAYEDDLASPGSTSFRVDGKPRG